MDAWALFDDAESEKVQFEFLQTSVKGKPIEITYLNSVTDNIMESFDKGIKETFFLLQKRSFVVPERISILYRGFYKSVRGNSADLAFAAGLMVRFINEGHLKTSLMLDHICVTGVLNREGFVEPVGGIKSKLVAALEVSKKGKTMLVIPKENEKELKRILQEERELFQRMNASDLKVISIERLDSLVDVFLLSKGHVVSVSNRKLSTNFLKFAGIGLVALVVCGGTIYGWKEAEFKAFYQDRFIGMEDGGVEVPIESAYHSLRSVAQSEKMKGILTSSQNEVQRSNGEVGEKSVAIGSQTMPQNTNGEEEESPDKELGGRVERTSVVTIVPTETVSPFVKVKEFFPRNGEKIESNVISVSIRFEEGDLMLGEGFEKISVGEQGIIMNKKYDFVTNQIDLDVYGKYGWNYILTVPENTVKTSSGRSNESIIMNFSSDYNEKLDFELVFEDEPLGWMADPYLAGVSKFLIEDRPEIVKSGKHCMKIESEVENNAILKYLSIPIKPNKNYRVKGYIKTDQVTEGRGANLTLHFGSDWQATSGIKGTNDWEQVVAVFHSKDATTLDIECRLGHWGGGWEGLSKGTAWFDEIVVEEVL
jgi:hypothetical protein